MWDGDNNAQQAWHTWSQPYNFAHAYFAGSSVYCLSAQNGVVLVGRIDPKVGLVTTDNQRRPFLDWYCTADITPVPGGLSTVAIPSSLQTFMGVTSALKLASAHGTFAGEPVGIVSQTTSLMTLVRSWTSGKVFMGIPYTSLVTTSQPVLRDYNGTPILTSNAQLLQYKVKTRNSSEFKAIVSDEKLGTSVSIGQGPLVWASQDLKLSHVRSATVAVNVIPARTDMASSLLTLYTDDTRDLNFVGIEYVYKYNQRIKRV